MIDATISVDLKRNDSHVSKVWFFRGIIVHFNAVEYFLFGFFDTGPTLDANPFFFIQVFVVLKEMRDLIDGNFRQVTKVLHLAISLAEFVNRDGEHLGVVT